MEINLLTISKLSSEIIDRDVIRIEHLDNPVLSDLTNSIYDKCPALWKSNSYKIYWQHAHDAFAPIEDYLSYATAMRLMTTNTIYVLVDDLFECWEDNMPYLLFLDHVEELERIERERDIYDIRIGPFTADNRIKITRKQGVSVEDMASKAISWMSLDSDDKPMRTDEEILRYALRNELKNECFTADMLQSYNHIHDLKIGFPKIKTELYPIPDMEFEKRVMKDGKGAKDKKDKKGKKDKGDKKGKKDKKKGGKGK